MHQRIVNLWWIRGSKLMRLFRLSLLFLLLVLFIVQLWLHFLHFLQLLHFLGFDLELSSQCSFPSFDSHAIGHLFVGVAAVIAPAEMLVVPTSPNRSVIVDKHILFVFTLDHPALPWVSLVFILFDNHLQYPVFDCWLCPVFSDDLAHLARVQSCLFLLHTLENFLSQGGQSGWAELWMMLLNLFKSKTVLFFQRGLLSDSL